MNELKEILNLSHIDHSLHELLYHSLRHKETSEIPKVIFINKKFLFLEVFESIMITDNPIVFAYNKNKDIFSLNYTSNLKKRFFNIERCCITLEILENLENGNFEPIKKEFLRFLNLNENEDFHHQIKNFLDIYKMSNPTLNLFLSNLLLTKNIMFLIFAYCEIKKSRINPILFKTYSKTWWHNKLLL